MRSKKELFTRTGFVTKLAVAGLIGSLVVVLPAMAQWSKQSKLSRATTEDNGDIRKATTVHFKLGPWRTASSVGDGPYGSSGTSSGDYDFWALPELSAGWILSVDVTAQDIGSLLDSEISVYDEAGFVIATNDDQPDSCCDSYLEVRLPADGTYYVDVHGCCGDLTDAFDSSSGTSGVVSEGPYELIIGLHAINP